MVTQHGKLSIPGFNTAEKAFPSMGFLAVIVNQVARKKHKVRVEGIYNVDGLFQPVLFSKYTAEMYVG
jgi:hypothetical protein